MKIIKAYKGREVYEIMVDDDDFEWLSKYDWVWRTAKDDREGYACAKFGRRYEGMHRMIMGVPYKEPIIVDHKDNNHKNNQKQNLRRANHFENQQNRKTNKGNTLPKGIRLLPSGKYNVRIQTYNKRVVVGTFDSLQEAVNERNRVAQHLHGEFFNPSYIL